jgi:enoyl-CoA hydratase/carnithine racemase
MLNGLFAEILPSPDQVLPRALELATNIAHSTSVISTYLMREMMWRNPGSAEGTHLLDSEVMYQLYDKKDKEEGINSFLEKRLPRFEGSVNHDMVSCVPWWTPVDIRVQSSNLPKL